MTAPTTQPVEPRKPRGPAIEQTSLMQALEADPVAAMQALADEAVAEWEQGSKPEFKSLLRASNV